MLRAVGPRGGWTCLTTPRQFTDTTTVFFPFQPITCHDVKEVSDTGAICLQLNESSTCVSCSPGWPHVSKGGDMQEEGGCKQTAEGRFLQRSQPCSDGVTHHTWGVSLGWGSSHRYPWGRASELCQTDGGGDDHSSPRRIPKG